MHGAALNGRGKLLLLLLLTHVCSARSIFGKWIFSLLYKPRAAKPHSLWQESTQTLMHRKHYGGHLSRCGRRTRKSASPSWWSAFLEVSCKTEGSDQADYWIHKHCRMVSLLSFQLINFWSLSIDFAFRGNELNCNGVSIIDVGTFIHYLGLILFSFSLTLIACQSSNIAAVLSDGKIKLLSLWTDLPARI